MLQTVYLRINFSSLARASSAEEENTNVPNLRSIEVNLITRLYYA